MLEALDSNQKSRLLAEQSTAATACTATATTSAGSASPTPHHQLHQGEAELAYLTHEGLFISDALSEAQQARGPQEQSAGSRPQQSSGGTAAAAVPETGSSDSASGTTESSSGKEQGFHAAGGAIGL